MKASAIATLLTSVLCFQTTAAFVDMAIPLPAAPMITSEPIFGDVISSFAESSFGSSTLVVTNAMAFPAKSAAAVMSSPQVESQFMGDMALGLSFAERIFRPNRKTMRLYSLGGRLLGLMADFIPDHSIHAEELLIQLFFMGMTVKEMIDDELRFAKF